MNSQRTVWLCSAAAVTIFVFHMPLFFAVVGAFGSNPYAGHVIFVPLLAALLLWRERRRLRGLAGHADARGSLLVALALVLAVPAATVAVSLQALTFVVALSGLVLWCFGARGVRAVAFPLTFLLLMAPPPREAMSAIAPPIQHLVAAFSGVVLDSLQIPVRQQGILLYLPDITLKVAEECAGLRFALIVLVLIAPFARALVPTIAGQALLIALSVPVALIANAARVAFTGAGAYAIGPHVVTGPAHYYIGKAFWAVALLTLIGLAWMFRSRGFGTIARRQAHPRNVVAEAP